MPQRSLATEYLDTAIRRMKYYRDLGEKTFDQLSDEEIHFQPNPESNSVAVIVQHMAGNMLSRWTNFLTEDGEKVWRMRDEEFEAKKMSKKEMVEIWNKGWDCFLGALQSLKEEDLLTTVQIRKESLSAIDAINRQMAHYPYHVGQIIYIAKILRNDAWKSLSIPKGRSAEYNSGDQAKDPARKY